MKITENTPKRRTLIVCTLRVLDRWTILPVVRLVPRIWAIVVLDKVRGACSPELGGKGETRGIRLGM